MGVPSPAVLRAFLSPSKPSSAETAKIWVWKKSNKRSKGKLVFLTSWRIASSTKRLTGLGVVLGVFSPFLPFLALRSRFCSLGLRLFSLASQDV